MKNTDSHIRLIFTYMVVAVMLGAYIDRWVFGLSFTDQGREYYYQLLYLIIGFILGTKSGKE